MPPYSIFNEFDPLRSALVCPPDYFCLGAPINAVSEYFFQHDPPRLVAIQPQYQAWRQVVADQGVVPQELSPQPDLPFQMYTRDIGFVIGERLFVANMGRSIRHGETTIFRAWLEARELPYHVIPDGIIEGGDVLVHHPYVFVGVGERTTQAGIEALRALLGAPWQVIPIALVPGVLHLDCACTIIGPETILWCPELIRSGREALEAQFPRRIPLTSDEVFHMATNVLVLNPTTLCLESRQHRVRQALEAIGYAVLSVDWGELKKLGGLFRCATLPLQRSA